METILTIPMIESIQAGMAVTGEARIYLTVRNQYWGSHSENYTLKTYWYTRLGRNA